MDVCTRDELQSKIGGQRTHSRVSNICGAMHTTSYYVDDPQELQRLQYRGDVFSSIHYMSTDNFKQFPKLFAPLTHIVKQNSLINSVTLH